MDGLHFQNTVTAQEEEETLEDRKKPRGQPSMRDLDETHEKIFALVESRDHAGVEQFLAERGQEVKITPKIGCSTIHHAKLNIANFENENEDSLLTKAVKVDCKMVEIVIKYGGNPNHVNKDRDTPLSIAANLGDKDTIDALLRAGANLRSAVVKLTSSLKHISEQQLEVKECTQAGFSVKPLAKLLAGDVYLKCRDPIKAAFDVCKAINRIKDVRDEFQIEFEQLIEDADIFAYNFLNHCDNMFEARSILTSSTNLLRTATDQDKKRFVSHPFSQQVVNERWYGETANKLFYGKTVIALKYFTSPIALPLLFLKFLLIDVHRCVPFMESSFSNWMKLLFTPCLCFATDAINFLAFLTILMSVCLIPFKAGTYDVTPIEYTLYYCVFARILIDADQMIQQGCRRYFKNSWNYLEVVILVLLVAAAFYKGFIKYSVDVQEDYYNTKEKNYSGNITFYDSVETILRNQHKNSMDVNYIYAVTEFILTLRLLSLLEISQSLGTMLIALKYLIADVIKFSAILMTVIFGTSVSIYSMTIALNEWNAELTAIARDYEWPKGYPKKLPKNKIVIPHVFETFTDTMRNVLWGTFGLLDVVNLKIKEEPQTTDFINVMMILYILLSCVLLLNMLIGILSSTFDNVKENCDIEWKFARSQRLKEYCRAQPFLFPFFPILFPFIAWFRAKLTEETTNQHNEANLAQEGDRDELISKVCDRFKFGSMTGSFDDVS